MREREGDREKLREKTRVDLVVVGVPPQGTRALCDIIHCGEESDSRAEGER